MDLGGARAAQHDSAPGTVVLAFAGHCFEPLWSGALYWRAERTLLVADLHLEKFSSYAKTGQLLPPYDTGLTLQQLDADLASTGAERVIALGDSFHRDEGTTTLLDTDRLRLMALLGRAHWTWIAGNHDGAPHTLGGHCVSVLERAGLQFTHQPRRGRRGLIGGHLHPAAHLAINGRSVRRRCFVHDGATLVLPAYGSGTGSLNVLGRAFRGLFDPARLEVVMLGRSRVYPVSPKRLITG